MNYAYDAWSDYYRNSSSSGPCRMQMIFLGKRILVVQLGITHYGIKRAMLSWKAAN